MRADERRQRRIEHAGPPRVALLRHDGTARERRGFLGGSEIFKSGFDVKGIKAAAAIWITGALGLSIATSYWWLGVTVGLVTAAVMFVADSFPDEVREEKQETPNSNSDAKK